MARKTARLKRTSKTMVARTGQPAPSWVAVPEIQEIANACFRACINPHAKPDLIRVYFNNSVRYWGWCYFETRIITLCPDASLETLAHEIAHLRVKAHCKAHKALTETLHNWIIRNYARILVEIDGRETVTK